MLSAREMIYFNTDTHVCIDRYVHTEVPKNVYTF